MPARRPFNVDDNHSPSSPVRHRRRIDENGSYTASRNAGMPSKEEQERRDAQMALELQQEEEERLICERAQVIEPTLSSEALSRIISRPLQENIALVRHLDDSEIDSDDSEDEDENESILSSDDVSEGHSIGEVDSFTTEEGESDDYYDDDDDDDGGGGGGSGEDDSSGSSVDGRLGRHFMLGQLFGIGDLLVANERREHRERRDTTPFEPPDETVIQCADWGQCTICFEDAPYDPVGCLHCQQLIGCKPCVNRWFRGGARQRADSPLSLGLSRVNHRQCPLCRHEYEASTPEVGSMFFLAPKN